jgi:hypothetical protein
MFFFAVAAVAGFIALCFAIPVLGAPFGLGALSPQMFPLAIIPPAVIFLLCEGLHRFLGDL